MKGNANVMKDEQLTAEKHLKLLRYEKRISENLYLVT